LPNADKSEMGSSSEPTFEERMTAGRRLAIEQAKVAFSEYAKQPFQKCHSEAATFETLHTKKRDIHFSLPDFQVIEGLVGELLDVFMACWEDDQEFLDTMHRFWVGGVGGFAPESNLDGMNAKDDSAYYGTLGDSLGTWAPDISLLIQKGQHGILFPRAYFTLYPSTVSLYEWHMAGTSQSTWEKMGTFSYNFFYYCKELIYHDEGHILYRTKLILYDNECYFCTVWNLTISPTPSLSMQWPLHACGYCCGPIPY
jgi:hypothetical protein